MAVSKLISSSSYKYSWNVNTYILFGVMLAFCCNFTSCDFNRHGRLISTKYGVLRGFVRQVTSRSDGYSNSTVEVFHGVPYASAPVGPLRFMPPVTPLPWSGTRIADFFMPVCPQRLPNLDNYNLTSGRLDILQRMFSYLPNDSEDCLYLNIYVPVKVGRDPIRLPVMVFIHGESYEWNSGNPYDGSVLASYGNVLVVTINFRLGILGFLPPLEGSSRGNFGLMDQVAALHWIQENIAEFGGDPKNVTIFGQGYGAACVNLLMISPMAKGLFHRAIMQSGSALSPWAIADEGVAYTRKIAGALGCPSDDNITMVTCLRERPLSELMRVEFEVPTHRTSFGPTVDGVVVPVDPLKAMENDNSLYRQYSLLFGVTKSEGYLHFSAFDERRGVEADKRDKLLRTLVRNLFNYHQQEIFLTVVNEYTDWTKSVQHPLNIFEGVSDALGDSLVVAPLVHAGNLHSRLHLRTFFYVFGHQTEEGDYPTRLGCVHGEELAYVFGAPLVGSLSHFPRNYTRQEVSLSEAVMTYWTNFAKYGDPNSPAAKNADSNNERGRGRFDGFIWPEYESVHQKYINLGIKPKVKDHYHAHRLSIWMNLIPKLHQPGTFTTTPEHHLLENFDNLSSYEGIVRPRPLTIPPPTVFTPFLQATTGPELTSPSELTAIEEISESHPTLASEESGALSGNHSQAAVVVVRSRGYSTALSVTIAIGCSLLILNVLVFAGVFYQRDKNRIEAKLQRRKYQLRVATDGKAPPEDSPEKKVPPPDSPCGSPQSCHTMKFPSMSPVPPPSPNAVPVLPPRPVVNSVPESQPLIGTGSFKKSVDSRAGGY